VRQRALAIKSPRATSAERPARSEAADIIAFNDIYHYFLKFSKGSLTAKRLRKMHAVSASASWL